MRLSTENGFKDKYHWLLETRVPFPVSAQAKNNINTTWKEQLGKKDREAIVFSKCVETHHNQCKPSSLSFYKVLFAPNSYLLSLKLSFTYLEVGNTGKGIWS